MHDPIKVPVKPSDRAWIHFIAKQRQDSARENGRRGAHGSIDDDRSDLLKHIKGCWGEMGTARGLNLFWDGTIGSVDDDQADVGKSIEVRTIEKPGHCLIMHDRDGRGAKRDRPFVLAYIGEWLAGPHILLMGYRIPSLTIPGRKLQQRGPGDPAYYVGRDELSPMSDLFDYVQTHERPLL